MSRVFFCFLFLLLTKLGITQVVGGVQSKGMDMNTQPYGFVKQISANTKEVVGNVYLYDQWFLGTVEFINGSKLENKGIRYNIESDVLEIRWDGVLKGAEGKNVKAFEILNTDVRERYVRASEFKHNGTQLLGFLKELSIGYYSLYSKTNVKLIKGTYVVALDIGEEDDEYSKNITYYFTEGDELIVVNKKKKVFASAFKGFEDKIINFINSGNLNLRHAGDLKQVFMYINSLHKG